MKVFFTIITKSYLAQARVLAAQLAEFHPNIKFLVVLVDNQDGYFDPAKEKFEKIMFPIGMVFQFEDWVAWCLLGNHGRFVYQPAVLATYRFHGDSFTHKQMQNQKIKSFAHLEALLCIFTRSRNKAIMVKLGNRFVEVLLHLCYKSSENWQLQQKSVEKTSFVNLVFKSMFRKKLLNLFLLIKGI